MCEKRKKAARLRSMACKIEMARKESPTQFGQQRHPDHCLMSKLLFTIAEDREEHLREAAIELEEEANAIESQTELQRNMKAIKSFLKPILIPLAAAILAVCGTDASQGLFHGLTAMFSK